MLVIHCNSFEKIVELNIQEDVMGLVEIAEQISIFCNILFALICCVAATYALLY